MSIIFYQIGDTAFHFHGELYNGETHNGAGRATTLFKSHQTLWPDMQYKPEMRRQTYNGVLLGDCTWTADQTYERLQRLVDTPTDIIGYVNAACCDDSSGCACQGAAGCRLVWYQNYGVLRSVKLTGRKDSLITDVSIDIEYGAYWRPLSRYFWEWTGYTGEIEERAPILPYAQGITPYPRCSMIYCKRVNCTQFVKRVFTDCNLGYDPGLWVEENCQTAPGYPKTGSAESWVSGDLNRVYWNDPTVWNAPLQSIYAFQNMPQTGIITITAKHSAGVWDRVTETSSIDLSILNGALAAAGYGGLFNTDIMYIGDVTRKPGFILRNGVVIDTPRPAVDFPNEWPGYLTPGSIDLTINTPGATQTALNHIYRRM